MLPKNSLTHNQDRNIPVERLGHSPFSNEIRQQHLSDSRSQIKIIANRIVMIFLKGRDS